MMVWSVDLNSEVFFAYSSSMAGYQPTLTYCGQSLAAQPDIPDTLLDRCTVFNTRLHINHSYLTDLRLTSAHKLFGSHVWGRDPGPGLLSKKAPQIMIIWLCMCMSWWGWIKGGWDVGLRIKLCTCDIQVGFLCIRNSLILSTHKPTNQPKNQPNGKCLWPSRHQEITIYGIGTHPNMPLQTLIQRHQKKIVFRQIIPGQNRNQLTEYIQSNAADIPTL